MSGLFVQKHAESVRAQGCEVRVIHSESWRELLFAWRDLRREGWMPDVVQLNVLQKQGVLALWLKRRYGIPYVIVEHWSGYLPENGMFRQLNITEHFQKETLQTHCRRGFCDPAGKRPVSRSDARMRHRKPQVAEDQQCSG